MSHVSRVCAHLNRRTNLDLQRDALKKAGCEKIFTDEISGAKAERPGLTEAFKFIRTGGTLVVWRLDRFGRSLKDLLARMEELRQRESGFKSLTRALIPPRRR